MSTYRPKNSPYYHYDFQFKGQRYHGSTNCTAKRDADRYERDRRTEAALGIKDKPSISIDDGFGLFWQSKGRLEKNHETVEYQLANLGRLLGSTTLLHDVDDLSVAGMIARRRGEYVRTTYTGKAKRKRERAPARLVSNATVNREVELLKRVVRFLAPRYKMPTIEWGKHRLKEPKERVREASVTEEDALFAKLRAEDADLADLVEFAMLSGARKNGVRTLLWSKVDLGSRWAEVLTKGDVWHGFPLSPRMVQILAGRPKAGPYVFTYLCRQSRRPLVDKSGAKHPGRVKGQRYPFSKQGWDRRWRQLKAEAGLIDFRFHDLRHTAASRITRKAGIRAAQILLGHTEITTTAKYAHVDVADLRKAMLDVEQSRNSPEQAARQDVENGGNLRQTA